MTRFASAGRLAALCAVLLLLAACTSLSLDTAAKLRSVDYLGDDISGMMLAFDMPLTLEPAPEGSVLDLDMTAEGNGERHVEAVLVHADASEVIGTLPPPAAGRAYYVFGFSEADKAALREAQAWARSQPRGELELSVNLAPRFCRTAEIDAATTRVSVLVVLPGAAGLAPLVNAESVASLLAVLGEAELPTCAGHSG